MSEQELRDEIAALRAEVKSLREQAELAGVRLGPKRETPEETAARAKRLVERIEESTQKSVPPVNRAALCTTSGEAPDKVRAEQTEETGQHKAYIVLCEDERKKGFVRPVKNSYKHVACGTVTSMGRALAETYARDPTFYTSTFCAGCNRHLPVAEFVWTVDNTRVGS